MGRRENLHVMLEIQLGKQRWVYGAWLFQSYSLRLKHTNFNIYQSTRVSKKGRQKNRFLSLGKPTVLCCTVTLQSQDVTFLWVIISISQ